MYTGSHRSVDKRCVNILFMGSIGDVARKKFGGFGLCVVFHIEFVHIFRHFEAILTQKDSFLRVEPGTPSKCAHGGDYSQEIITFFLILNSKFMH